MYQQPHKKALGQHFLHDPYYLSEICHVIGVKSGDFLIEIGPGSGCLTDLLLPICAHLTALEVDADCVAFLQKKHEGQANFHLIHQDCLQVDWLTLVKPGQKCRWVGNLPYNVSVPIMLRLIQMREHMEDAVFLVQKEVAQRVCAHAGEKHYGRLGIVLQCVFDCDMALVVPPDAFDPPPKVDSAVVSLRPKTDNQSHFLTHPRFDEVLMRSFSQRRKMLRKIFHKHISDAQWEAMRIDPTSRPDKLHASQFYQMACCLAENSE